MRTSLFLHRVMILCLAAIASGGSLRSAAAAEAAAPKVIGYFELSSDAESKIDSIPWDSLTSLQLSFIGISSDGVCAWLNLNGDGVRNSSFDGPSLVKKVIAARDAHNPQVKVILSAGGWTMSQQFSQATSTVPGVFRLAQSCTNVVRTLGLDGIDYDWEYPTRLGAKNCPPGQLCQRPSDPIGFAALLQATRACFKGNGKTISVAVYANTGGYDIPYNAKLMDPFLDSWNVMAYDAVSPSWHPATGFHAGMSMVQATLKRFVAMGATPSKVVLGVPMYGYVWHNVPDATPGSLAVGKGQDQQIPTPTLIDTYTNDPGCTLTRSDDGDAYFCATGDHKGDWVAIDTRRVLQTKANFVHDNGYGGVMVWEVGMDDGSLIAGLTRAVQDCRH